MPPRRSRDERSHRRPRKADPGRLRALREDVEVRALERFDGGDPPARERGHGAAGAPAEPTSERLARRQQPARTLGLELEQPAKRLVRLVEHLDSEAAAFLRRKVNPPEREVARD